jgi:hypothetical protein
MIKHAGDQGNLIGMQEMGLVGVEILLGGYIGHSFFRLHFSTRFNPVSGLVSSDYGNPLIGNAFLPKPTVDTRKNH